MHEFTIKAKPFSWNENLSEIALEDFSMIQKDLSYGTCQTIGMALAKLKLMEDKGLNPDTLENIIEQAMAEIESSDKYIREYDDSIEQKAYNSGMRKILKIIKEGLE